MIGKNRTIRFAAVVLSLLCAATAVGTTLYVDDDGPADFNNIQAAIDDSNDGDTIVVADGVYMQGDYFSSHVADFQGKAITLRSENGPHDCILYGDYTAHFHMGESSASVLSGFTISGAWTTAVLCEDSSPTIMNNLIINNPLDAAWAAISLHNSSALIMGNVIANNQFEGDGIECYDGSPIIINNTIANNGYKLSNNDTGICCVDSTPVIMNCVIWDSAPGFDLRGCEATYSCLEHNHLGLGNTHADPMFVDPENGDYHLLPGSPCIDAGYDQALPPLMLTDIDGNPRISDRAVDIGAYEMSAREFLLSRIAFQVYEGEVERLTLALTRDPLAPIAVTITRYVGDPDIHITSGATLCFDSSDYATPKTISFEARKDDDNLNGLAIFWITAPGFQTAGIRVTEQDSDIPPDIIYVDHDAPPHGDGESWQSAYKHLQDALINANTTEKRVEIHVAQGTYRPDENTLHPDGTGDREATFQLISGLTLRGGYAGPGGPDPNARDTDAYPTVLTGDLDSNDGDVQDPCDLLTEPTRAENSYHVVTSSGSESTAVLDGFTITSGNADGIRYRHSTGAGIYNSNGKPTILNCVLSKNAVLDHGGGICSSGDPTLTHCTFTGNYAVYWAGAMSNGGSPRLTDCIFVRNASMQGGAINTFGGDMALSNCLFTGNSAVRGGALWFIESYDDKPTLTNCTLAGNSAQDSGGAIFIYGGGPTLTNCIVWDNPGGEISGLAWSRHSDIKGGWPGKDNDFPDADNEGNIDIDPCFADPGYWDTNSTPDDPWDDSWTDGDYHLKSQAGRWDANEGQWVVDDVTSPCIDTGDPMSPIGYEPFPNGGRVNMGAYGGTVEASKSYFGGPLCQTIIAGDINGDCKVDFSDLAFLTLNWLRCPAAQ